MVSKISILISWLLLLTILTTYLVVIVENETNEHIEMIGDPHVKTIIVCEDE